MRLTLWTDYALRTLIYLGVKGDSLATIAEIAEGFDISRPHLMKIVNRLGVQGYVETVRGRKGGIKLARPPAQIRVGAVVRDTEEDLAVMDASLNPASAGSRDAACCGAHFVRRRWPSWRFSTATRWPTFWRPIDVSPTVWGLRWRPGFRRSRIQPEPWAERSVDDLAVARAACPCCRRMDRRRGDGDNGGIALGSARRSRPEPASDIRGYRTAVLAACPDRHADCRAYRVLHNRPRGFVGPVSLCRVLVDARHGRDMAGVLGAVVRGRAAAPASPLRPLGEGPAGCGVRLVAAVTLDPARAEW